MLFYWKIFLGFFQVGCYNLCLLIGCVGRYTLKPFKNVFTKHEPNFFTVEEISKVSYSVICYYYDWICIQSHDLLS